MAGRRAFPRPFSTKRVRPRPAPAAPKAGKPKRSARSLPPTGGAPRPPPARGGGGTDPPLCPGTTREGGKVRKGTVGNISHRPAELVGLIRRYLQGERFLAADESFSVEQSLPHGHVEAALAMARRLELARLLDRTPSRGRQLVLALLVERVLNPASKLATARGLSDSTLASQLGLEGADEDDLYRALDWLGERQQAIERRLVRRHLRPGEHALYDVSSSYFEGRTCPLAQLGYSRDRRRGSLQLVYGLLCDRRGRPLSPEVFPGGLHDDQTLPDRLQALTERFGLSRLVLIVDRGMVTEANLAAIGEAGFAFITALRAPQVKRPLKRSELKPPLCDEPRLDESASADYPVERLIVCRNPLVGEERARKREALLAATEEALRAIEERVARGTLRGTAEIGLAVGAVWNRYRVRKHFRVEIADESLRVERKQQEIAAEASLDGIYILRTSVTETELDAADVVRSYKQLAQVERAHRTLKGPDLELRTIHHRPEQRVRAPRLPRPPRPRARHDPGIPRHARLVRKRPCMRAARSTRLTPRDLRAPRGRAGR